MWIETKTILSVPRWAVQYLEYGERHDLTDDDVQEIEEWLGELEREGLRPIGPIDGSYNEFCSYPAFGLACDTVDFYAEEIPENKEGK